MITKKHTHFFTHTQTQTHTQKQTQKQKQKNTTVWYYHAVLRRRENLIGVVNRDLTPAL